MYLDKKMSFLARHTQIILFEGALDDTRYFVLSGLYKKLFELLAQGRWQEWEAYTKANSLTHDQQMHVVQFLSILENENFISELPHTLVIPNLLACSEVFTTDLGQVDLISEKKFTQNVDVDLAEHEQYIFAHYY